MAGLDRPTAPDDAQLCGCGHLRATHDPIGLRYCTATRESNLARTCICTGELVLQAATSQEKSPGA